MVLNHHLASFKLAYVHFSRFEGHEYVSHNVLYDVHHVLLDKSYAVDLFER